MKSIFIRKSFMIMLCIQLHVKWICGFSVIHSIPWFVHINGYSNRIRRRFSLFWFEIVCFNCHHYAERAMIAYWYRYTHCSNYMVIHVNDLIWCDDETWISGLYIIIDVRLLYSMPSISTIHYRKSDVILGMEEKKAATVCPSLPIWATRNVFNMKTHTAITIAHKNRNQKIGAIFMYNIHRIGDELNAKRNFGLTRMWQHTKRMNG